MLFFFFFHFHSFDQLFDDLCWIGFFELHPHALPSFGTFDTYTLKIPGHDRSVLNTCYTQTLQMCPINSHSLSLLRADSCDC